MSTRHSPRQWAIITAAIATADAATIAPSGVALTRGGEDWCRVALTALESPAAANHASTIPDRLPDHCLFDPQLLRAWLGAPAASTVGQPFMVTVADQIADRDWSQPPDETTQDALATLLAKAQRAGVFGVHGYDLELYGIAGETGWIQHQLLVARPDAGPGLASNLIATVTPAITSPNVDSAISVLSIIAGEVAVLLVGVDRPGPAATANRTADRPLLPHGDADVPYRIGPDGRPFPALDQVDPAAVTPAAPPPLPPTEPVADRRR